MVARERSTERLDSEQMRKGSMRQAVRQIFHRASKVTIVDSPDRRPSPASFRSSSKTSASPVYRNPLHSPIKPASPDYIQNVAPYRTLSATMHVRSNDPSLPKGRSPNAVEFPHSAKLKPLDLGNPFANTPEPRLRRRKTLPNALKGDTQVKKPDSNRISPNPQPPKEVPIFHEMDGDSGEVGILSSYQTHRRSRSAENLKSVLQSNTIHHETAHGAFHQHPNLSHPVLRASGFISGTAGTTNDISDRMKGGVSTEDQSLIRCTPRRMSSESIDDAYSVSEDTPSRYSQSGKPSTPPHILPETLIERVSKLETCMVKFQQSLESVSAEQEKRAITARNLEKTLHDHFVMNNRSQSRSGHHSSLSTNSPSGRLNSPSQDRIDSTNQQNARDVAHSRKGTDHSSSPRHYHKPSLSAGKASPVGEHTFRSLYEMLVDERSARRKLEQQVKVLAQELSELRQQTTTQHALWRQYENSDAWEPTKTTGSAFAVRQPREVYYDAPTESIPSPRRFGLQPTSSSHIPAKDLYYATQIAADVDKFHFDIVPERAHDEHSESTDGEMF